MDRRRGRWLIAALVFGVLFAAADTRELVHQLDESQTTVAAIAGVLIGLHQPLRQVFARAVAWGMIDVNPSCRLGCG